MSGSKPIRLLTISEAAEYLAISERSIKRLIARGLRELAGRETAIERGDQTLAPGFSGLSVHLADGDIEARSGAYLRDTRPHQAATDHTDPLDSHPFLRAHSRRVIDRLDDRPIVADRVGPRTAMPTRQSGFVLRSQPEGRLAR